MATYTRDAFIQEMANKRIALADAKRDARLSAINFSALDTSGNGYISGSQEMAALFAAIDRFDNNGIAQSVETGTATQPTRAGLLINVLRSIAIPLPTTPEPAPAPTGALRDPALAKAFPSGLRTELARGSSGMSVVALQYTLGRLGFLNSLCDGAFGGGTEQAVKNFQISRSIPATGRVNAGLLGLMDQQVVKLDLRTTASRAADPLAYLSNFRQLGLPVITMRSTAETFTWASSEIRTAFGQFVGWYWEVMKRNRVEGDCKNIALFLMDQFRKQIKEDRFINLPHPVLRGAPEKRWIVATADKTQGLFTRADRLKNTTGVSVARTGYQAVKNVQALDVEHSMLYGVNVHYPEVSAGQVAKSCTRLFDWDPSLDNRGDSSKPEVPVNQLAAGNIIFIDHTGDGSFDHTVTVIDVEKDANQRTRKLVLAVGSYDDVRDNSSETSVEGVGLSIVNTYSEEVTVELDVNGRVTSSTVTYASEPSYIVDTRYSARTTLMEQKAGGKLIVARWG